MTDLKNILQGPTHAALGNWAPDGPYTLMPRMPFSGSLHLCPGCTLIVCLYSLMGLSQSPTWLFMFSISFCLRSLPSSRPWILGSHRLLCLAVAAAVVSDNLRFRSATSACRFMISASLYLDSISKSESRLTSLPRNRMISSCVGTRGRLSSSGRGWQAGPASTIWREQGVTQEKAGEEERAGRRARRCLLTVSLGRPWRGWSWARTTYLYLDAYNGASRVQKHFFYPEKKNTFTW